MQKEHNQELDQLRHSFAHLLAAAVLKLYPETKPTIGPAIENGFYYDFEFAEPISENDLPKIEKQMKKELQSWEGFERIEVSKEEALERFKNNPYKSELINEFTEEGQQLTLYKSGEFVDLCRGGHVEEPRKELKYFKLLSLAGAYWRGDEKNIMLTRIYGTAFRSQEELENHLQMLEEAKLRDHRKIAKELELYLIEDIVGKGMPLWLPKGTIIKNEIESFAVEVENHYGYDRVSTPHLAKQELFETSGHLPYYKDSMYPAMEMDDGTYYLKAMNCPHHHIIYRSKPHSYKELPIRLAEYGMVYRNELSGTLAGLLRVRALEMNDAHIYCRKDQIEEEIKKVLEMTVHYFEIFGLKEYWFRLSKWDPNRKEKYFDEPESWKYSESVLRKVLEESGLKFIEVEDEAAFYGPKIDVQFKSVIGREESMSTIQLDFVARERFNLTYVDNEGKENQEVFVIHRAPLSTHERFMAFLIEHFAGVFPVWLCPVQIQVVPVGEGHFDFSHKLAQEFKSEGIRVEVDDANETVGNKIRKAAKEKIPYMLVIGDKEMESDKLIIRKRGHEEQLEMTKMDFISLIRNEIKSKVIW